MDLPPFATNAVQVMAWVMNSPEIDSAELIRFGTLVANDPHTINRWAEVLSRFMTLSSQHGGPELSLADYAACVDWVASMSTKGPDALVMAKWAMLEEALRPGKCPITMTYIDVINNLDMQLRLLIDTHPLGWTRDRLNRALVDQVDSLRAQARVVPGDNATSLFALDRTVDSRYTIWADTLLEIASVAAGEERFHDPRAALAEVTESLGAFKAAQAMFAEADQALRELTAGGNLPLLQTHRVVYSTPGLPLFSSSWIDHGLLAGRNPLTAIDAQWLIHRGVTHILDLRTSPEWAPPRFGQEALDVLNGRVERHHIPVEDMDPPTPAQLDEAVAYLETTLADPRALVYVHCRAGNERTGAILVALHARRHHLTYDQALAEIQRRRRSTQPLPVQEAAVRRWLK